MNRIVSGISTLRQHIETLRSKPEVYRPRRCPSCGHGVLWHYGCYSRKADRRPTSAETSLNPIPIPRYLCSSCLHSCSRLPECIPPRRWYSWLLQQKALKSLLAGCLSISALRRSCRNSMARLTALHDVTLIVVFMDVHTRQAIKVDRSPLNVHIAHV